MNSMLRSGACALAALVSSPASAADWWWVSGDPEEAAIVFIDTHSMKAVSVDRGGAVSALPFKADCAKPADTAVQRFACASEEERMNSYAMLGGLNPRAAALALFASGRKEPTAAPRRRVSTLKVVEV